MVIVGAGLSGLCAARQLVARKVSCVVLEARGRIGGRMVRQSVIEDGWIDLGGQWIGPTQTAILDLTHSLGVSHFDWYSQGSNVLYYAGARSTFAGAFPPAPDSPVSIPGVTDVDLIAAEQLSAKIEALVATVNITEPWLTPNAQNLDGQTVTNWLDANSNSEFAKYSVSTLVQANGDDPSESSMLFLLSEDAMGPASEDPEKWLLHGAAGQIPPQLAAELDDRIVLGQPVVHIRQDSSSVTVTTPSGRYRGKCAIVAVPPYLAGAIDYEPSMPAKRLQLTQRVPMQSIIKNACIYPTAWWRGQGLSGITVSQLPALSTADSSPPSGKPGILTSFFAGADAVALGARTAEERKAVAISNLVSYFGEEAAHPTQYVETNWPADQWTGGAYADFFGPGVLTEFGSALRAPVGRIHWAGTETATRWMGFFDGAVRSGQDAASAAMKQL